MIILILAVFGVEDAKALRKRKDKPFCPKPRGWDKIYDD